MYSIMDCPAYCHRQTKPITHIGRIMKPDVSMSQSGPSIPYCAKNWLIPSLGLKMNIHISPRAAEERTHGR